MRWRVKYDLHTTAMHQYGRITEIHAPTEAAARAGVERAIYANKVAILKARHDYEGDGFRVDILTATPMLDTPT